MGIGKGNFLKNGHEKEIEFAALLIAKFGGLIEWPSKDDDINLHIDLFWDPDNGKRKCSFDVKGLRKNKRSDNSTSLDSTWVEFTNVRGNKGSLYGKQDYIAFETDKQWLIVRRGKFASECENSIKGHNISNTIPDDFFMLYQRKGRKDIIMKVPISFIKNICCKIIDKEN